MNEIEPTPTVMSQYEHKRWGELQEHWEKAAKGRRKLPPRAQAVVKKTASAASDKMSATARVLSDATPSRVKDMAESAIDTTLAPTMDSIIKLLELINDWVVELTDPEKVFQHHRSRGRDVRNLADLRKLDLEVLDEVTRGMTLRWRTLGASQGAAFGALAMIPVPVLGSIAAISLDMVAMQALTGAIATRVCYAYGIDPNDPAMRPVIDRMVARSYRSQAPKAGTVNKAGQAFAASKGRVNWSKKLREDHRLMAAVEKLMKKVGGGGRIPVGNVRMGMPLVAVFAGAGTNSHVLGDIARQARNYGATLHLVQKYGLELPGALRDNADPADVPDGPANDAQGG